MISAKRFYEMLLQSLVYYFSTNIQTFIFLQSLRFHQVEEIFLNVKETLITFLNRSKEFSPPPSEEQHPLNHQQQHEKLGNSNHATSNGRENNNNGSSSNNAGNKSPITAGTNGRSAIASENIKSGGRSGGYGTSGSGNNGRTNAASNNSTITNSHTSYQDGDGGGSAGRNRIKDEAIRKIATLKGNFLGPSFYLQEDFLDDAIKTVSEAKKNKQKL